MKRILSLILVAILGFTLGFWVGKASASELRGLAVFNAVNNERIAGHEPALIPDAALVKAAQLKADDMVKNHYFAHKSPAGNNLVYFMAKANARGFTVAGENLAKGFSTTEDTVKAWMASPTHRANILDKEFRKTGIGIAKDGNQIIVVQYFGGGR